MRVVPAGPSEGPVVTDLIVGKSSDKQIAGAHIGQRSFHIERRAREAVDHGLRKIGCVLLPQIEHDAAVPIARGVPIARIAVEPIG